MKDNSSIKQTEETQPFLALVENGDLYDVFLINPTDIKYPGIKKLTGGYASGDDFVIETGKAVFDLPELKPHSFIKIDDIHYIERDYIIWYELDFLLEDGSKIYKKGSISKYYLDKASLIEYNFNKEGWIENLIDRPENKSIDEIVKTMNMKSRYITFNEDGSIKSEE